MAKRAIYIMKHFKSALRTILLICMLCLAGIGIGLSGGVPLPHLKNRRDFEKEKIELVEDNENDSEQNEIKA